MPAKNAVIFACDINYIWPAILAANAIVAHGSTRNFDVKIFSSTPIPENFADHAAEGVEAEYLPFDHFTTKTSFSNRMSIVTFLRIFALEEASQRYERVVFLDSDIAVRHGDVCRLWEADLGGRPLAAVRDWINWGVIRRPNRAYLDGLGVTEADGGYFNAGFMLVDCAQWRAEGMTEKLLRALDAKPEIMRFHDQSVLNYVLKGRWAEASPLWNWQTRELHHILLIETRDPHIVHFNARRKPWRDRDRMLGAEFSGPMRRIAAETGWSFFDDQTPGPMRERRERLRAEAMVKLYQTLPAYLETIAPYLARRDFIDRDGVGAPP